MSEWDKKAPELEQNANAVVAGWRNHLRREDRTLFSQQWCVCIHAQSARLVAVPASTV